MNKKNLFIGLIILMVIAAGAVFVLRQDTGTVQDESNLETGEESTNAVVGLNISKQGDLTESDKLPRVLNTFSEITKTERPVKSLEYIEKNIANVSKLEADILAIMYVDHLKEYLDLYSLKLYNVEYQNALKEAYDKSFDLTRIKGEYSEDVMDFLRDVKEDGYLLYYRDGFITLSPNYNVLNSYGQYLSDEVNDYLELISREANEALSAGAGITISWEELAFRVINAEMYLQKYPNAMRYEEVKQMYLVYLDVMLRGMQNTPIYDWRSGFIRNDVYEMYNKTIIHNANTTTAKILEDYLALIENNGNMIDQSIYDFAIKVISDLSDSDILEFEEHAETEN